MSRKLEFYHKSVFNQLKEKYLLEGYEIISISNYLSKNDAESLESKLHIVDLSSVGNSFDESSQLQMQLLLEQVFPSINSDVKFIADLKYFETFQYKLRFCFELFEEVELSQTNKVDDTVQNEVEVKNNVVSLSEASYSEFISSFNDGLYGHDIFKSNFKDLLNTFRVFNKLGEHKVLSFFILGESGVGKTEVARQIHKSLKGNNKIAKINFGNYSSHDALNSLIGSPRGYIGSDGGELFNRVLESDVGLILIDEFEKSNTAVFNYFLDVLENGKLTNSLGDEININGYVIVFTSNVSKDKFSEIISPELRSRFDYVGEFSVLNNTDKRKFVEFRLKTIIKKYNSKMNNTLQNYEFEILNKEIDVTNYKNMRELNKRLKDVFVKYVSIESQKTN